MRIVLIGFMGSGKTTVAKLLAKKLRLKTIDMDDLALKKST
ncbi:MAG: Shikimate kinase [Candidatus Daviesbacteria bacterium GW2011_GWF2_38_6]|uniref:Shikimate kinase n=1 Tax=Candidatus Daviesbacteria bacterium GW2011_GWF2_38_6 TaxID=1618432 RepID=A0A0G0KP91_9BACT|nr:MAG: Shikimate kinase [Candidatus Daviesbacteria bacterium GW2011_GWF2_38_6]